MDNEKNMGMEEDEGSREADSPESAPRARNRTVMLTPEITGQVRARLAQDLDKNAPESSGGYGAHESPHSGGGGFVPVSSRRAPSSDHSPEGRGRHVAPPSPQGHATRGSAHLSEPSLDRDAVVWTKPGPLVGFLVSFDRDQNGEFFVIRTGRMIVTSEVPSGGNFLFIKDESVSPMHAIVRISESGEIQVLDQLSECGSGVKRFGSGDELELSGEKCTLAHGDVIRFGKRSFHVCVMPKREE